MKYIYYFYYIALLMITCSVISCDDNNKTKIDEDWKLRNEIIFSKTITNKTFNRLESISGRGAIAWKNSTEITDSDKLFIKTHDTPLFNDTVVVRYEGWYIDNDNKNVIFDSTERGSLASGGVDPNKTKVRFAVNSVIDGWSTMLQQMKIGDERLICVPQELGYGSSQMKHIPAYTTLWFRIKLYDIVPMKGLDD